MPSEATNTVAIVTGGARGLGRAMTLALMRSGVQVTVLDLPASAAESSELVSLADREGLRDRLFLQQCDVTQWRQCIDAVKQTIERFGALHGLVNNAGVGMQDIGNVLIGKRKPFYEVEADTWRHAID
jgi:NAD(P)-dependent dehydrogenase (short-subunit alcohol dehydrogenase family)